MFRINKRNGKGIIPMTRIMLYWGYDADIVECPEFIAENLAHSQREFDAWMSNRDNNHGCWVIDNEGEFGLSFNADTFVDWLNSVPLKGGRDRARIVKRDYYPLPSELKNMPKINF